MFNVVAVLVFLAVLEGSETVPRLPNIDYVGVGYDAYLGNPHSDRYDPGFTQSVVKLTYDTGASSADGQWLIPDNIQALQTKSCSYESETTVIGTLMTYQNILSNDANVFGSNWGAKFSASSDYSELVEGIITNRNVYVTSQAECIHYEAMVLSRAKIQLSDAFVDGVSDLPDTASDSDYNNFISVFGTHYASVVLMGAKAILRSEFNETAWANLRACCDPKRGAKEIFHNHTVGVLLMSNESIDAARDFENHRKGYRLAFVGSQPSKDNRWKTWADSTAENPYPVEFTLRPLTELVIPKLLPGIAPASIQARQTLLIKAYDKYCARIRGCLEPAKERKIVTFDQVNSSVIDSQQVSCRPGFNLLYCALGNLEETSDDLQRYAYPIDSTTCSCNATASASCISYCSNAIRGVEVVTNVTKVKNVTEAFFVRCPGDKKVVGCHVVPSNEMPDDWREFYPSYDGRTCTCREGINATCLATCAYNIINYEIRTQYGVGDVQVRCSPGNTALGCGARPVREKGTEGKRTVLVDTLESCKCTDQYGITCYAICGQIETASPTVGAGILVE